MNFDEFKEQLRNDLLGVLPKDMQDVEINFQHTEKLQKGSYDGMMVRQVGQPIGMNVDLNRFYSEYENGTSYEECLEELGAIVSHNLYEMPKINVEQLNDYERLKPMLSIQVVSTEPNVDMLANIPHKEIEDLSMVYRFVTNEDQENIQSILVTNKMLEVYGISAEQVHHDALEMAPIYKPMEIRSMAEVVREMMGDDFPIEMMEADDMMYVATTECKSMGAGVIAYPGFIEKAAEKVNGDFYLLPSSLYEVLLVPDRGCRSYHELESMVREVNETQVSPEERLSDNVYHYDSKAKIFEIAKKYEERQNKREVEGRSSVLGNLDYMKKECADRPKNEALELKKESDRAAI